MANRRPAVYVKGAPPELLADIEQRVTEFERDHEPSILADGPGAVPRIRRFDYVVAIAVNMGLILWLVIAFMGGGQ